MDTQRRDPHWLLIGAERWLVSHEMSTFPGVSLSVPFLSSLEHRRARDGALPMMHSKGAHKPGKFELGASFSFFVISRQSSFRIRSKMLNQRLLHHYVQSAQRNLAEKDLAELSQADLRNRANKN